MSVEIRAKVQRHPKVGGTPLGEPWLALVYTLDPEPTEENYHDTHEVTWCGSLPEAIQAAYLMRNNLERQLMDEVHASRASRRAERCLVCELSTLVNGDQECDCGASKAAHLVQHPHATLPHRDNPFDTCFGYRAASSVHTMEATA